LALTSCGGESALRRNSTTSPVKLIPDHTSIARQR
jgi:hypothetical protein